MPTSEPRSIGSKVTKLTDTRGWKTRIGAGLMSASAAISSVEGCWPHQGNRGVRTTEYRSPEEEGERVRTLSRLADVALRAWRPETRRNMRVLLPYIRSARLGGACERLLEAVERMEGVAEIYEQTHTARRPSSEEIFSLEAQYEAAMESFRHLSPLDIYAFSGAGIAALENGILSASVVEDLVRRVLRLGYLGFGNLDFQGIHDREMIHLTQDLDGRQVTLVTQAMQELPEQQTRLLRDGSIPFETVYTLYLRHVLDSETELRVIQAIMRHLIQERTQ